MFTRTQAEEKHGITLAQLSREGVPPKPELLEFAALVGAALAAGVCVLAHHASFDVRLLNRTAHRHGLHNCELTSATMLCTMHSATRHCGLRTRGDKRAKAPTNEELYMHLHDGKKPTGQLHRALPDCRITLSSYIAGKQCHWW